uniref:Aminotransferase-like plant mobile domain-containing protein n=1 Tax=Fagus sylvatica TaxID=28930 RepID=A0A2N9ETF3_FAGSY
MASSSKKSMKGSGGSSSGKGGPSTAGGVRTPRDPGDSSSGSDSVLGSPESHGDMLGRPTVDPWYRSGERFSSVPASLQPPPPDWEWLVIREDSAANMAWTPNFREIKDLQIQRNEMLAVPLVFDFQCSRAVEWADWIDLELADRGFCDRLEQAGVLRSILISRCSNMYCDTEALRQLVRRWCPSTHTFFFAHGEMTVTLEDVENYWLLPILGDQGPADLVLSPEELEIESALADYIGRKNIALGTQATRFKPWMEHFNRETDPLIRRAAFVAYWLSKCVFGEHPAYSIKPLYFPLAVKVATGVCFPLAPLLLGQIYTQLDLLHAEELAGASCHIVTTAFNSSIVHTFLWEHALEYIKKGRKPYEARNKFASMPEGVVTNVGDFQCDVPAVYRWVGSKFYDHSLVPWTARASAHRVRKQFGFDQEIPAVMGVAAGEIPTINPFLRDRAFAYWSSITPRVIIPSGDRIGVYTIGSPHSPLWLRGHPHVAAPGKVPSSRGRRTASVGISALKRKQPDRSKKGEAVSKDFPVRASERKKTSATKGSKEVLTLKTAVTGPPPAEENIPQGVSAPICKKPVRKTRAGKRTFVPPAFPSAPSSIAARVAARKSSRGVIYSKRRSKQRADASSRIPIEISDDLDSSSSNSDSSGAAAEENEGDDAEVEAAETVPGADDFAADISSIDTDAILSASSGEKDVEAGVDTEDDEVSMDELGAAEASSESTPVASASKPISAEEAVKKHETVGVVTGTERIVKTTPVAVTSSGGLSGSGSHMDLSLLDSSPFTRQYVRRARRGSIVSTDSERTGSATIRVSTPSSPLPESGGTASTPIIVAAAVSAAATIQESETAPAAVGEVPGDEGGIPQTEHAEVAASGEPVQAYVIPGSDAPVIEEELAQGPINDIDMADAHDSYDEVLAKAEDDVAGAQAADTGATTPVAAHGNPTKTAGSGNEAVAEEERIHQSAAVESAIRGQPGLLSAARPAIPRTSVLADMDAFFREFDRTSFSSRHAEHFWTFDDRKADFEIFQVPQGGIRFLKALWKKYGSCSSYFRLGVHVGSSMLTLLCCVLAHMEHTRLEDISEVHILEWKAVVKRVLAELREVEARVAALRDALSVVAPNPWDLASARRASAESDDGSALHDLLA